MIHLEHETWGEDYDLQTLKLLQGEQYSPEYLALNPNHSVPMLEIHWSDGSVQRMLESVAMVEWLADAFPEKSLAPAPAFSRARADYLQMLQFGGSWMDAMLWFVRVHRELLPEEEADARGVQRTLDKFTQEVEPQLRSRLQQTAYVCGDTFSAADIVIGHNVLWARSYDLCQEDVFKAYVARLAARPAFAQAFSDAGRSSTGKA